MIRFHSILFWVYPRLKKIEESGAFIGPSLVIPDVYRQNIMRDYLKGALREARDKIVTSFFGEHIEKIVLKFLGENCMIKRDRTKKEWREMETYGDAEYSISVDEDFEIESALL